MLEFDILQSGLVFLLLLAAGEGLSRLTRGAAPAVLFAGIGFTLCFWAGLLPEDLGQRAGFSAVTSAVMMMVVVNMGASMDLRAFLSNWRVVVLSALTFAGQLAALFLVVGGVYGRNTAVGGLPGGMATALIVQERARALGYDQIIVLSVLLLSTQALVGCPLATLFLRQEARRLQTLPQVSPAEESRPAEVQRRSPPGAGLPYGALLRLYAVAWAASRLEMVTGLSRYILCLLLGVGLSYLGLLDRNELAASKSDGFLFFLMMCAVISGFSSATPQMFTQMLPPLLLVLAVEVVSVLLVSMAVGRLLGLSGPMSRALAMNIMIGFPMNMLISQEIIQSLTEDPARREILTAEISSRMIIGGMVSTTVLATAAAGLLAGLMY